MRPWAVRASAALARALPRGQELLLVEAIDGVPVADPSALWFVYDWSSTGSAPGVVTAYGGCNLRSRGGGRWIATTVGCPEQLQRALRLPAYCAALFGKDPLVVAVAPCVLGGGDPHAPIDAAASGRRLMLRRPLW